MRKALITGITGQDGAYLAKLLLNKGYEVFGTYRRLSTPNFWRLDYLKIFDKIKFISADLADESSLNEAIRRSDPDEIYHLAAQSFVEASFEVPISTGDVTGIAVTRMLEAIRHYNEQIKFYFASTSEMFGVTGEIRNIKLRESDKFQPMSPYAAAKLYGYWVTNIYRNGYGLFASNGILFNHESPIRGLEFVTRKITNEVAKIAHGLSTQLKVGNINTMRDWGYAPEYVEAMWGILNHNQPDDFIIATGESHSVQEFIQQAFSYVGMEWEKYVVQDKRFLRPLDVPNLVGDCSKASNKISWSPKTKFEDLVKIMIAEDMERWEKWLSGDKFPWDVPCYPNENSLLKRISTE